MKILMVIDQLEVGGAERVFVDLSNILSTRGLDVTTLTIVKEGPLRKELKSPICHVNLNRRQKYNPVKLYKLHGMMKKHDIVHVHMRYNLKYVWLASTLFFTGKPIVFHDHYGSIKTHQEISGIFKWIINNTFYIGVSQELCEWAENMAGLPREKIFKLPNIIVPIEKDKLLPKKNDQLKLVLISNFSKQKNIPFAIELIRLLKKQIPVHLTIYGIIVDKKVYEETNRLIHGGLEGNVDIVTNESSVQPLLCNYDLAIHCATSETGPLVLIEYLSKGLPFISYNTGEVVNTIRHETPELIIDNFNYDDWIQRILHIDEKKAKYSNQLKAVHTKYFSIDNYFNKCKKIYQDVLTY